MPVVPILGMLRQKVHKIEVGLSYIPRSCLKTKRETKQALGRCKDHLKWKGGAISTENWQRSLLDHRWFIIIMGKDVHLYLQPGKTSHPQWNTVSDSAVWARGIIYNSKHFGFRGVGLLSAWQTQVRANGNCGNISKRHQIGRLPHPEETPGAGREQCAGRLKPTWHRLESLGRRKPQFRKCLREIRL